MNAEAVLAAVAEQAGNIATRAAASYFQSRGIKAAKEFENLFFK